MPSGKFVSYIRVSTDRQGRSGLGLEAQREAVAQYLNGGSWELLGEFLEVETGKGAKALDRRPQLKAALAMAKRERATLIIAKLDRLSRNVHFITGLMETGVTFVAADRPDADRFLIQLEAVLAEREARVISDRTKAALSVAKARGTQLGKNGVKLALANKLAAVQRMAPISGELTALANSGLSLREIARTLNDKGIVTPNGGQWFASTVSRAIARLEHG